MRRVFALFSFLVSVLLVYAPQLRAQGSTNQTIGALRTTGEVYVDDAPVTGEVTIFASDIVRTGPKGAAGLTIPGRGMITIDAQTRISFGAGPYFAKLETGKIGVRAFAGAKTIDVQFGQFVFIQETEVEAAGEVTLALDGSAQVTCTEGSVGVINLKGPQSPFLHPGDSVSVSANGEMEVTRAVASTAATNPPVTASKKSHKTALILLGVAAAGGAGAAVALATKGHQSVVSPSSP